MRRVFTAALAGMIVCGAVAASAFAQTAVTYQINPAHTGSSFFPEGFDTPLVQLWGHAFAGAVSYPLIADGRVFVNVGNMDIHGSHLVALDKVTGELELTQPLSGTYYSALIAYDAGMVFAVNHDGLLRAFAATSGELLWSAQLPGQYSFSAPPVAANGVVYVGGAGSGGTLYAVRQSDGAVLWTQAVANGDTSSPTLSSDGVFVSYPCQAYEFDQISGARRWQYKGDCSGGGGVTAAYYNDAFTTWDLEIYEFNKAIVLNGRNGRTLATFADLYSTPAFQAGVGYYLGSAGLTARTTPINRVLWTNAELQPGGLPVIVVNGIVLGLKVNFPDGTLIAIDGKTGNILQTLPVLPTEWVSVGGQVPGLAAGEGIVAVPNGTSLTVFATAQP